MMGIDSALYSGSKCYFFSGDRYVRVTRGDTGPGTVDPGYPAPITAWNWPAGFGQSADEVSFSVSECVYGWTAAYAQAGTHVTVRIRLDPDAGISNATMNSLRNTWRTGILDTWAGRFECLSPSGSRRRITFDVDWVTTGAHHNVRVRTGPARSNMTTWDTGDSGNIAAHEFGHMLGHPDEYADSACPSRSPVSTGTVMDDNTETVARLYNRIATRHGSGHTPVAESPESGEAAMEAATPQRNVDELPLESRSEVLGRLRAIGGSGPLPDDAGRASVSLEVTGGAAGERYHYRLSISGTGTAERSVTDEVGDSAHEESTRQVDEGLTRATFAAADQAGLLDDVVPPALTEPLALVPDSLVAVLTVADGDVVRRVVMPAGDPASGPPGEPSELADVPLRADFQFPAERVSALEPVLELLHQVEDAI